MLVDVQFAMVTFHRHFPLFLEILEGLLGFEGESVDSLEHFVFFRTFPVSAGETVQGEAVFRDFRSGFHMRTLAKVPKRSVAVKCQDFSFGIKVVHLLDFVILPDFSESSSHFLTIQLLTFKGLTGFDDFFHPLFDHRQVFRRERIFKIEIVVESVFNRGTESQFGFGSDLQNSLSQNMRQGMPDPIELGIFCFIHGHSWISEGSVEKQTISSFKTRQATGV